MLEASPEERQAQLNTPVFLRPLHVELRDTGLSTEANEYAAEFIRGKIKEKVKDPETAKPFPIRP